MIFTSWIVLEEVAKTSWKPVALIYELFPTNVRLILKISHVLSLWCACSLLKQLLKKFAFLIYVFAVSVDLS